MKRILHHEEGTSILEFALILPIFLMLVLGVFDFGNGFNTYIGLSNATREGALWIASYPTDLDGMNARIYTEIERVGLSADDVNIILTPSEPPYAMGETVTVTLQHNYQMMFGAITEFATVSLRTHTTITVFH